MIEVEEAVMDVICERTSTDVDGVQDASGNIWTSRNRLRSDAPKPKHDFDKSSLEPSLQSLLSSGNVIEWHGLLAPATDEHLDAIIKNERQSDITRPIVISTAKKLK